MKNDKAPKDNAVRHEIDREFAFLDDIPSLHDDIMRRIRREKTEQRKIRTGAVLTAALVLLTITGLAVSLWHGFVFLDREAHGEPHVCVIKDDCLYVLGQTGLWVYRSGSEQAQQLLSSSQLPHFSSPLQIELLAAENLLILDRGTRRIWVYEETGFSLMTSYAGTMLDDVDERGSEFVWQDEKLYIQSDHDHSIFCADPATGEVETLPLDNVTRIANYRPGQLLALTYSEHGGTAVLIVDTVTGEQRELCRDSGLTIRGISYAEERDEIYGVVSGYLSRWVDHGWQKVCGAALPHGAFFYGAFADSYVAVSHEGIQFIPLDGTDEKMETLVIQGLFDSARYDHGFQQSYPGVTVARHSEAEFDIRMAEEALRSGSEADLLHVRISSDTLDELWGLIEPLRTEKLLLDTEEMMPALHALLLQEGEVYAVPSSMLVGAWQTNGAPSEPMQRTLQELLEESRFWAGEETFEGSTRSIIPWKREDYAAYLLKLALRERKTGALRFADDAFIAALEALKERKISFQGADDGALLYTTVSLVGYLNGSEGVIPYMLSPTIRENAAPQIPAYVTAYVLNPRSQHKETAIRYLEYVADNRFAWEDALMKPYTAQPVLGEWARERIAQMGEDGGVRRKQIEDDPANWEVLEENLRFYREQIAPFVVIDEIQVQILDAHEQSMLQVLMEGLNDEITAEECAQQLETMAK